MFAGLLTLIICTPSALIDATIAYVLAPIVNISTSAAPLSASNSSRCSSLSNELRLSGSLTSIICTPLSSTAATMA